MKKWEKKIFYLYLKSQKLIKKKKSRIHSSGISILSFFLVNPGLIYYGEDYSYTIASLSDFSNSRNVRAGFVSYIWNIRSFFENEFDWLNIYGCVPNLLESLLSPAELTYWLSLFISSSNFYFLNLALQILTVTSMTININKNTTIIME